MLRPPDLKAGDKVGILSTARKISLDEIQPAIKVLEDWGLEVIAGDTIGLEHNQYAGTDQQRRADIQKMMNDPEIKAIICARGGYGTVRIIDDIDYTTLLNRPKWIVGYSDLTVLHAHLNSKMGLQTLHATMPINFEKNSTEALESLRKALFGEPLTYEFPAHPFNRSGVVRGPIYGGNLSVIYSITGTSSGIHPAHCILFLEDLDEYLYHVDRMMMNLKRGMKLDNLGALIVGGMTDMNDNAIPYGKTAEEIIHEHLDGFDYPVCFGFPAGHIEDNRTLILGRQTRLSIAENGCTLEFEH